MRLSVPIAIGMLFQTLYVLIDLYFVAQLGESAIAGVGAAGNAQFLIMALTQVLGVGTMALIAQASGRKDREDANLIFNQSLLLAIVLALATLFGGYALTAVYMRSLAADAATVEAGITPICIGSCPVSPCSLRWSRWVRPCAAPASRSRRCSCRC